MANIDDIINRQIHHWDHMRAVLHKKDADYENAPPEHHPLPLVAFSPELGCGSRFVTDILSQQTGFQVLGWSLIDKIAEDIHVQRRIIDRLDERTRSKIEALIEGMLWGRHVDREEYFRSLIRVLRAFALQGGIILIGRGSNFIVQDYEALRIRLLAPERIRVENLMRFYNIDNAAAYRRMHESDKQREEFVHTYFKKNIHDPLNYDLTLNLGTMLPQTAAGIILRALEQFPNFLKAKEEKHLLADAIG